MKGVLNQISKILNINAIARKLSLTLTTLPCNCVCMLLYIRNLVPIYSQSRSYILITSISLYIKNHVSSIKLLYINIVTLSQ